MSLPFFLWKMKNNWDDLGSFLVWCKCSLMINDQFAVQFDDFP